MAVNLSAEESQQLLRTVEMFEAITESQPDDYQSLEILKEAYDKLGRKPECLQISKRLAAAYVKNGQIAQAILEYEGLAQEYPNDAEVKQALATLEAQTVPPGAAAAPSLTEHSKITQPNAGGLTGGRPVAGPGANPEAGDLALANVLLQEKIITRQAVDPVLAKLRQLRAQSHDNKSNPLSLLPLLAGEQMAKLDDLLILIVERSRLPYIPLNQYDVDRDVVTLIPADIAWQHCLVPFDLLSRSVMVATANPFDEAARKQVEAMLDYHVFWYVSLPQDIAAVLRRAHGWDKPKPKANGVTP
jgi:hypothetical protein